MIPVIQIKGGKMHAISGTDQMGDTVSVDTMCGRVIFTKAIDGSVRDTDRADEVTCKTCSRRLDEEAHTTESFAAFNAEMGILDSPEAIREPRPVQMTLGRYRHGQIRHQRALRRHRMKESLNG